MPTELYIEHAYAAHVRIYLLPVPDNKNDWAAVDIPVKFILDISGSRSRNYPG